MIAGRILGISKVLLFIALIISNYSVQGGIEKFSARLEGGEIQQNATVTVIDDKFPDMVDNPMWTSLFSIPGTSKNAIIFSFDLANLTYYTLDTFSVEAEIQIQYLNRNDSSFIDTCVLTLYYDKTADNYCKDIHRYDFTGGHQVTATILSLSTTHSSIPVNLALDVEIEVDRVYNKTPLLSGPEITCYINTNSNELCFYWPFESGIEAWDLEWTFVDDYQKDGTYFNPTNIEYDFNKNAGRVRLNKNFYSIPLVYEHGYVLYRARGINYNGLNRDNEILGLWSNPNATGLLSSTNDKYAIIYPHMGDTMIWNYQMTMLEDGFQIPEVSYLDGKNKLRQQVRKSESIDKVIVLWAAYDYFGRPAIQTLPVPVNTSKLEYYEDFALNTDGEPYTWMDFDKDSIGNPCKSTIEPMLSTCAASEYYSPPLGEVTLR